MPRSLLKLATVLAFAAVMWPPPSPGGFRACPTHRRSGPPLPVIGALSAFGFRPKRRAVTGQLQKPASSERDSSQCATGWGLIRMH